MMHIAHRRLDAIETDIDIIDKKIYDNFLCKWKRKLIFGALLKVFIASHCMFRIEQS
jgi:hypothetical protein